MRQTCAPHVLAHIVHGDMPGWAPCRSGVEAHWLPSGDIEHAKKHIIVITALIKIAFIDVIHEFQLEYLFESISFM